MWRKFLLPLLVVAQSFSWAQDKSSPATASPSSSKAIVYVYRYKQFVGAALAPSVYCDDVQLARMENGRYFAATVDAGKHIFRSNDEQSGIVLQAVARQQYFIRVDIAAGFMKGHGRLTLMDSQQGTYELTSDKLKPLDASKVVNKDRVSIEVAHPQPQAPAPASLQTSTVVSNPAPVITSNTQPVLAPPQTSNEPAAPMMSVGTAGLSPGSPSGDQTSLGDAARLARQKKKVKNSQ
jgi:Protein of unknown function (DUF2846)